MTRSFPLPDRCDCPRCVLTAARQDAARRLPIFTMYDRPTDTPNTIIVRLWLNHYPTPAAWAFPSIAVARDALDDLGLVRMARHPEDDPKIVEMWL